MALVKHGSYHLEPCRRGQSQYNCGSCTNWTIEMQEYQVTPTAHTFARDTQLADSRPFTWIMIPCLNSSQEPQDP